MPGGHQNSCRRYVHLCAYSTILDWTITCFSTCQVGVSRFFAFSSFFFSFFSSGNCEFRISVGTAGPQPISLPAPNCQINVSGHCWNPTASSRSQWALPDFNRKRRISVGIAGPQLQAQDLSGQCRTSTASSRSQWALPDLHREPQILESTAGTHPEARERMSDRMPERMPERLSDRMPERMPE